MVKDGRIKLGRKPQRPPPDKRRPYIWVEYEDGSGEWLEMAMDKMDGVPDDLDHLDED